MSLYSNHITSAPMHTYSPGKTCYSGFSGTRSSLATWLSASQQRHTGCSICQQRALAGVYITPLHRKIVNKHSKALVENITVHLAMKPINCYPSKNVDG